MFASVMRIYVASSWRNAYFPLVIETLRREGFDVYDFRNPPDGGNGFRWSDVGVDWLDWSPQEYRERLSHPKAEKQFDNDIKAMMACDACVLLLPCGRSAHTEAGWFAGKGKPVILYMPEKQEPELMYKLFSCVCCDLKELIQACKGLSL